MFNIMLDKLPTEYNSFPINSDFRIGIQIFQLMSEDGLTDFEKIGLACDLLFDLEGMEKLPDAETAQEAVQWFLSGWYTDKTINSGEKDRKHMDYDVDQWRIYSAFLTQFNIDLNTADMHFWAFMGLLSTLNECAFTRIIDVRMRKIDPKMSADAKKALKETKARYALEDAADEQLTPQEQAEYDAFMKYAKKGRSDKNGERQ